MNPLIELTSLPAEELKRRGIEHTPKEILSQPSLWIKAFNLLKERSDGIRSFVENKILSKKNSRVILSGAGTSHFIGLSSEDLLRSMWQVDVEARASTDIVTGWKSIFLKNMDTTLISFSRSGNSPESVGAFLLADEWCEKINHIIVTCNKDGRLASLKSRREAEEKNVLRIVLPEEANDKGLAMTASFTTMVMTAQFLAYIKDLENFERIIQRASKSAEKILREYAGLIKEIADLDFERGFFLGTGPLYGCAAESHLKLQELTAGRIICKFDSFLGIRHGPKVAINDKTIAVYFVSSDPFVRRYELDLMKDIYERKLGLTKIAVCCGSENEIERYVDHVIDVSCGGRHEIPDLCRPNVDVIVGQLLGLFTSLKLGLKPDTPSEEGVITRVVEGVKIYDHKAFKNAKQFKVIIQ
ncbi:SIS domain-containing protein [Candidatus Bathyarchaeota archaeon]|nr:SIS domain-containing protein [Candidatus Bathyarchaeota archaeon]